MMPVIERPHGLRDGDEAVALVEGPVPGVWAYVVSQRGSPLAQATACSGRDRRPGKIRGAAADVTDPRMS
jgi:hypothetical protein